MSDDRVSVSLYDRLTSILQNYTNKEFAIVIDGKYMLHNHKLVYVNARDNGKWNEHSISLNFYYKGNNPATGKYENSEIENAYSVISERLLSNSLYNVEVPGHGKVEHCVIKVCTFMGLLIMESCLYSGTRSIIEHGDQNHTFVFSGNSIDISTIKKLRSASKRNSYKTFADLIFAQNTNRFLQKLQRRNKFYAIQKAFIPVYVEYDEVYNPLKDSNSLFKKTLLYQVAKSKNRLVEFENLRCYFLTHREICECLNMQEFARFTPKFLYYLIVGLMYPNYEEFPSKSTEMEKMAYYRPAYEQSVYVRRSVLSYAEISHMVSLYQGVLNKEDIGLQTRMEAEGTLSELRTFRPVDRLYAHIANNHSMLTSIGSPILDDNSKTTIDMLYEVFGKAELRFAENGGGNE